jgi:hypothetical protein
MTSAAAEPPVSSPRRARFRPGLWLAVAVVFAVQVGVLFWLGNPPAIVPVKTSVAPVIHLAGPDSRELLALQDPTLILLPHRENFSGDAWVKSQPVTFDPLKYSEPTRPLALDPARLGTTFAAFMLTNAPPRYEASLGSESDLEYDPTVPMESVVAPSTLRQEGGIARLRLLTAVQLPPRTNSEVLPNTEVQLMVNTRGIPFSAVVVSSSKDSVADATALEIARGLRFAPPQAAAVGVMPADKTTFGKLIFQWQTVPPAATNAPPTTP